MTVNFRATQNGLSLSLAAIEANFMFRNRDSASGYEIIDGERG
jgi:hypothetical protein